MMEVACRGGESDLSAGESDLPWWTEVVLRRDG